VPRAGRRVGRAAIAGLLLLTSCAAVAACGSSSGSGSAKPPAGLAAFGYSTVAASTTVKSGGSTTLHSGDLTVLVPAHALPAGARFDLLTGSNSYWKSYAPAGQKVLAAFAFRVIDKATNHLIVKFDAPVVVKVTNSGIRPTSQYLNTTPTSPPKVLSNPKAPKIAGTTLAHGNVGDPVGWLVTSPGA